MTRDEQLMLPRWIDYYVSQVGAENILVLDDNSVDGSTTDLPCATYRLPPGPWKKGFGKSRERIVNGFARGLLACTDVVIFCDVDELIVPDPAKYSGLMDYLTKRGDDIIAPLAIEVLHNDRVEPPLDPGRPLLEQRRFVKWAPAMCKPLVKRVPTAWEFAFHGIREPFEIDRDLWMLHVKYADVTMLAEVAEHRRRWHEVEGRGHPQSFWPIGAEELTKRLRSWTEAADATGSAPVFDPDEVDLEKLVRLEEKGYYRAAGGQISALDTNPLREVPERLRSLV
jgi:hypothetical protein